MESILIKALQLILSLSILVIVHELGHFLFSKLFKVRVEKFYLFFNPWFSLFKYKPKNSDTEYGIGWLPLGGYVKISGMMDESMDKEALAQPVQPYEFRAKPSWQRLLIMVGGVLMNVILAFFIYAMILFSFGKEELPLQNITMGLSYNEFTHQAGFQDGDLPLEADGIVLKKMDGNALMKIAAAKIVTVLRDGERVDIVLPVDFKNVVFQKDPNFTIRYPFVITQIQSGSSAKKAGLLVGDSITGVNGKTLDFTGISKALFANKGQSIELNLYRQGEKIDVVVIPSEQGKLGVGVKIPTDFYSTVTTEYGFFESFPAGVVQGINTIKGYLSQFKFIFSKEGAQSLGGFGTIGSLFPDSWDWERFWNMTAFLSIILAVMNLLPIPALDGGHVMFLLYEVVTRRKPSDKFMERAQMVGMILLISLLLYANGNDIFRFFFK
ncbi:MAG: RIP metalloprotease RseP [Dysgonamonadaceae bacterium]|jgi:regulator of sigma E protease|nr:RIP metalloprotease RseP [Dysgonamonadaceae bacterium]